MQTIVGHLQNLKLLATVENIWYLRPIGLGYKFEKVFFTEEPFFAKKKLFNVLISVTHYFQKQAFMLSKICVSYFPKLLYKNPADETWKEKKFISARK